MTATTKDLITNALFDLAREKSVDKITVKDIVERCGVNRNTFYYHFKDIPDVVEYAISANVTQFGNSRPPGGTVSDYYLDFLLYLNDHKKTVLHIYKSLRRESFVKYLRLFFSYMNQPLKDTPTELDVLQQKEKDLVLFLCTCVMEGVILEWMESDMNEQILEKAQKISRFFSSDYAKIMDLLRQV